MCVYLLFKCTDIDVYVCMYRLVRGLDGDQNKTESLHCIQTRLQKEMTKKGHVEKREMERCLWETWLFKQ